MGRILCLALLAAHFAPAQQTLYRFHNDFWLNLHHFLYVLGRARMGAPDSSREAVRHATEDVDGMDALEKSQLLAWDEAIDYYKAAQSPKDAIFDEELVRTTRSMATYPKDVPAPRRAVLDRAAPIYRQVWWPRHERANRERIAELEALLTTHGRPVASAIARAWGQKWPPSPITVNLSAYANWAGAYSTEGLIVIGSLNRETSGASGFETLFHETMHQWDDDFQKAITNAAAAAGVQPPRNLLHSLIFFTAGYFVAAEFPGYKPYADTSGVWNRGLFSRARIAADWTPYLAGRGKLGEALGRLVRPAIQ
jgi:hypothetical protein